MSNRRYFWIVTAVLAAAVIGLVLHAYYYLPFISDDALISFRYARRLLKGLGLTWTEGQPVEGYSNLLWLLLVALVSSAGIDCVAASRILGFLCMALTVVLVGLISAHRVPKDAGSVYGTAAAVTFLAGSAPMAVWTIGGLEQPLLALALAAALFFDRRTSDDGPPHYVTAQSAALGALCLTRPDGVLFTGAAVLAVLIRTPLRGIPQRWRQIVTLSSIPGLLIVVQTAFRLWYYNAWVPNTALVKLTPSLHHLRNGALYVATGFLSQAPLSLFALSFLVIGLYRREYRNSTLTLALPLVVWLTYVAVIGGDIFPAFRHWVPAIVLLAVALGEASRETVRQWASTGPRKTLVATLMVVSAGVAVTVQFFHPENRRAVEERWEWQGRALGLTLKEAFEQQQPLVAVTAAGCIPYWSELPCLDMLGLNDAHIARQRPPELGRGVLGHEFGDAEYILERNPDLIVFAVGKKFTCRVGGDLFRSRLFHARYSEIKVQTAFPPSYTALVWYNRTSSRIGPRFFGDTLIIPGYALNAFQHTVMMLRGGKLSAAVTARQPAGIVVNYAVDSSAVRVVSAPEDTCNIHVRQLPRSSFVTIAAAGNDTLFVQELKVALPRENQGLRITQ